MRLYDERLCPLKGKGPSDIDMVFVRENTEGAYTGTFGFAHKGLPIEVASQVMTYTRIGVERAIRYAFDLARARDKQKKVTLIDKANALRCDVATISPAALAEVEADVKRHGAEGHTDQASYEKQREQFAREGIAH